MSTLIGIKIQKKYDFLSFLGQIQAGPGSGANLSGSATLIVAVVVFIADSSLVCFFFILSFVFTLTF